MCQKYQSVAIHPVAVYLSLHAWHDVLACILVALLLREGQQQLISVHHDASSHDVSGGQADMSQALQGMTGVAFHGLLKLTMLICRWEVCKV